MKALAVYSIKGGVGKTATAVNLGYIAASRGMRTLIWDLDPQGAASFYFRIEPRVKGGARKLIARKNRVARHVRGTDFDDLDLLPADFSYRNLDLHLDAHGKPLKQIGKIVAHLEADYDCILIDCAPSISLVSENVFEAADALLVPTIPTTLSLRMLDRLRWHLDRSPSAGLAVLPFFCMVDRRKSMHREYSDHDDGGGFLTTRIPYSSVVERMGVHRAPVPAYAPGSEAAAAYAALWTEIENLWGWNA